MQFTYSLSISLKSKLVEKLFYNLKLNQRVQGKDLSHRLCKELKEVHALSHLGKVPEKSLLQDQYLSEYSFIYSLCEDTLGIALSALLFAEK